MSAITRHRLFALAFVTLPIVGVAVACTFPDVTYESPAVTMPDTGTVDATVSDAAGSTPAPDGTITEREGGLVDAAGCGNTCDCDGDGYWRDAGCDASAEDASTRKGFGDCDDTDSLRHPKQNFVAIPPVGHDGDWDCDGVATRFYPINGSCTGTPLVGCGPTTGFYATAPACGETADVSSCGATGLLTCGVTGTNPAAEPCK